MDVGIALIALLSLCLIPCIHGQTCSETFDLNATISINASLATSCIRCIDMNGDVATNAQWTASGVVLSDGMNGATIVNGILVINDAIAFLSLAIPVFLQCTGSSNFGLIFQAGIPSFVANQLTAFSVYEGGDLVLPCQVRHCSGNCFVHWKRNTHSVDSVTSIQGVTTTESLTLRNVQQADSGSYKCFISRPFRELEFTVSVIPANERVPMLNKSIDNQYKEFDYNQALVLTCPLRSGENSTENPITVTWVFTNVHDQPQFVYGTVLTLEPEFYNRGVYKCTASNSFGLDSLDIFVEINTPPLPAFDTLPAITLTEGSPSETLNFTAPTSPVALSSLRYQWDRQNNDDEENWTPIQYNSKYSLTPSGHLIINTISLLDAGLYRVTISNAFGSSVQTRQVNISPRPVSTTDPISSLNLSVINNSAAMCLLNASTVTITCNTNSFPRPSVRFLKGQEFITPGVGAFQRVSQTFIDQIQLSDIVMEDAGTYRCELSIDPTVFAEKLLIFCTEPFITNFSSTQNTIVGDTLRVECEIRGIPTPVITWLKDNKTLSSGIDISRFSGNEFLSIVNINSATLADTGTYTCVGKNDAGTVSMPINVEVNVGRPDSAVELIIGLAIGIPAILLLITLVVILLSLLLVKSRKKGAYTTDPVIYDTVEDNSSPDPVVISVNAAYGLAEENSSGGNAEYETIEDNSSPDPVVLTSDNPAYGLAEENPSGGNAEYETIEGDFTPDPVLTSDNPAYGLAEENPSGGNAEYETIEGEFTPDPVLTSDNPAYGLAEPGRNETLV